MLESYSEKWPDLILELLDEIYVDGILTGAETVCLLVERKDKLIEIFFSAGISLTKMTKRTVLSAIAKIFDPLGFFSPIRILFFKSSCGHYG